MKKETNDEKGEINQEMFKFEAEFGLWTSEQGGFLHLLFPSKKWLRGAFLFTIHHHFWVALNCQWFESWNLVFFRTAKSAPEKLSFSKCVFGQLLWQGENLQCSIGYDIFIHGPCSKIKSLLVPDLLRTKVQIEKTPCKSEENELPSFCYFEATSYYSTDCHWWDQWRIQRCVFWRIPSFSLRIQGPLWNQFNIFIWSTVWSQNPSDCILISVTRPLFVYSPRMSAGSSVVEDRNPFPPNKGMPISL